MNRAVSFRYVLTGVSFAALWASAGTAGKFGLQSADPLFLFTFRFMVAGVLMLVFTHFVSKDRLPSGVEWKHLAVFGLFNTALYLGIFISALQYLTAGITALAIAMNPLIMSVLSSRFLRRKVRMTETAGIFIGLIGVAVATWPLLESEHVSPGGFALLLLAMVTYSIGSIYFSSVSWQLSRLTINGWQVFLGGLMLLPFAVFFHEGGNKMDLTFWLAEFWLILPVSVISMQLWLVLLRDDAVKASLWLFLCPIFGLSISIWLLDDPFSWHTVVGTLLVLTALAIGQTRESTASARN
jgi:probable blue pigment (indigoidine) exporter